MSSPTIILRTAPGESPYEELDLTDKVNIIERAPTDYDAAVDNYRGEEEVFTRAMRRNLALDIANISNEEAQILRRWKHDRKRITVNGNYGPGTVLYHRFARSDPADFGVGVTIGPNPTFTRAPSSALTKATFRGRDGRFHYLDDDIPRYGWADGDWGVIQGMYFGEATKNNAHPSLAGSVGALWSALGGATFTLDANLQSQIEEQTGGSYVFYGATSGSDYLVYTIPAPYIPLSANELSFGLWILGQGTFELQCAGSDVPTTLSGPKSISYSDGWQRFTIDNVNHITGGLDVSIRLFARSNGARCQVGNLDCHSASTLSDTIVNTDLTTWVEMPYDALAYAAAMSPFESIVHVGLRTPLTWPQQEDAHVLSFDFGGGGEFYLKYDAGLSKWSVQKESAGVVSWTPVKSAGEPTVISIWFGAAVVVAFENGVSQTAAALAVQDGFADIKVGHSDLTAQGALKSEIYFIRVDGPHADPTTEMARVWDLYADADQRYWTKISEGRLFKITSPAHKIVAGIQRNRINLTEVKSIITATTEDF